MIQKDYEKPKRQPGFEMEEKHRLVLRESDPFHKGREGEGGSGIEYFLSALHKGRGTNERAGLFCLLD
jgi:hypothetical protein